MLQRLFIFLLIFLILPDIYLYLRFIVHLTAKRWLRILYWLPAFLLSTGLLYLVYFSNNAFAERHTQAIGWFSIFFFLFTAPCCLSARLSGYLSTNGYGGPELPLSVPG